MPKKWKLAEALRILGQPEEIPTVTAKSNRSADGKTVVITLWRDGLDYRAKPIIYDTFNRPDLYGLDRPSGKS